MQPGNCAGQVVTTEILPALQRFEHLKQDVFRVEKSMLRAFGFVTHVEHPHKFVLSLLQILEVSSLLQEAWNLTNDRCMPQCDIMERVWLVLHRTGCRSNVSSVSSSQQ